MGGLAVPVFGRKVFTYKDIYCYFENTYLKINKNLMFFGLDYSLGFFMANPH